MENSLPKGWVTVDLHECCEILDSMRVPINGEERAKRGGHIPYYGATGQVGLIDDYLFDEELVLIGEDGAPFFDKSKKIAYQIKGKSWVNNHAHVIRANEITSNRYLEYFLCNFDYTDYVNGTTRLKLTQGSLRKIPVALAPTNEQKRIVAKLDKLMEKIERSRTRLERIPKILKRFRQSIISAAVNGQLTRSRSEWKEVNLGSLVDKGDIFDGPFGSNLKTSDYTTKGVRVIRLENIEHLFFVNEKETFISKDKYQTLLRHTVGEGDIIFSSFIAEEIRACILPILQTKAVAKADCFCIRPNEKLVNKRFLLLSLVSSNSYNQLVLNIHGATRPRINTTQLKELTLQVPGLEDQNAIVRRVEQLFAVADKIEARYSKIKAFMDKVPQSLLAKAFRGELVTQDPKDEPADRLLSTIRTELKPSKKYKLGDRKVIGAEAY